MKKIKKQYFKVFSQIFVMIIATVAFSYFSHESSSVEVVSADGKNNFGLLIILLKIVNKIIWSEKNLVSAQEAPIQTCVNAKDGRSCVEYLTDECAANCEEECIPMAASQVGGCKIGSCYDESEGTCAVGVLQRQCSGNGKWIDDPYGNAPQCKKGCCIMGGQTLFTTEHECIVSAERLGISKTFRPEINTEFACLAGGNPDSEGACILGKDPITTKNLCRALTKSSCEQLRGTFYEGALCSHTDLNTNCEKQKTTGCFEDRAEVYWVDSCGNKENIYDADKTKSWNNGKLMSKGDACSLRTGNLLLANRGTCGNCDYFAGSFCGERTPNERLLDSLQNVVCRDMSCIDEAGKKRAHGESWCEYQSAIGVDGGRSVDPVGSRHYRKVCAYGEIRTEPCADYRTQICVENKMTSAGLSFSSASCRINMGKNCWALNMQEDRTKAMEDCQANSDCFVKSVAIGSRFNFQMCAPRYPPGFDMLNDPESAGDVCALGSQKCTMLYVKTLKDGWKCKSNCKCASATFTQQMNDLCMSLGDCGAKVNYDGELTTGGYSVSRAPPLDANYLNGLKKYATPIAGRIADVGNLSAFTGSLGIPNGLGSPDYDRVPDPLSGIDSFSTISGMVGGSFIALIYFNVIAYATTGGVAAGISAGSAAFAQSMAAGQGFFSSVASGLQAGSQAASATAPTAAASIAPFAAAAVAMAAAYYAIKMTGIGPGLSPAVIYATMALAAVAGYALAQTALATTAATGAAATPIIGWIALALVIIFISTMKAMGIGKTREKVVEFKCYPWRQPRGGLNCDRCGKDGYPCSAYACQSLGATCRFINEGTNEERCVAEDPNDVSPPTISPWSGGLLEGYEYAEATELGVKLKTTEGDGCVSAYSNVKIGILLDKAGRCRYASVPLLPKGAAADVAYYGEDDTLTSEQLGESIMQSSAEYFSSGILRENHSVSITIPSAESLGLAEYDPTQRTDINLYIRCENANEYEAERDYAINFCVKPGKDLTAPIITVAKPFGEFIKSDATEQDFRIFTNEPANCKWSSMDKDYSIMENSMSCENDLSAQKLFGWECNYTVSIRQAQSTFYVRCADKPWAENETDKNKNSQSKVVVMKKTEKLEITSASPDNSTLTFGTPAASINIDVQTNGGIAESTGCMASFDGENYFVILDKKSSSSHSVTLQSMIEGSKKVWLKCEDGVGNIATRIINFKVKMDSNAPIITRTYYDAGNLIVKTNEPAECALSQESCGFNFANGTLMSGTGTDHYYGVERSKVYFIRCKDPYSNIKGSCDLRLKVV